jgi:hypothetical protein
MNPRLPNCDFQGKTDSQGYIFEWSGCQVPEIKLLHFLFTNNCLETTIWQMGFLTTGYFEPAKPQYTCADVNFVLVQGQQPPHITLYADINGYGAWIEPLKEYIQRPIARPKRNYKKLSKDQNKALMEHFVDEPYPNPMTYRRLSEDLNIPREMTMRWFRRQRAQGRRHMKEQKRSMLYEEAAFNSALNSALIAALEVGCLDTAASEVVDTDVGIEMETATTEPVITEPVEIEHTDKEIEVGNAGTVFIEMGGKVLRRSGRQAEKGGK